MKNKLLTKCIFFLFLISVNTGIFGQGIPELLYYKFNNKGGSSIPNQASNPPSGTSTATINGGISQGSTGTCGSTALVGTGTVSSSDYVDTKWTTSLSGSWTISMWTKDMDSSTNLFYLFSDLSAGALRCFSGGVAGAGNLLLRMTGMTDVLITGGASKNASVSTFVYNSSAGFIYAYLNGKLINSVSQSSLTLSGTAAFMISGYNSLAGLPANGLMDEFRFYTRALTASEVAKLTYGGQTSGSPNIVACGSSYKSPSGKYTWTKAGTYTDTIPNSTNCDSFMTINLKFNSHTYATIRPVACDFFISPSKTKIWTATGNYTDIIKNKAGCDSIITVNLTIKKSTSSNLKIKSCTNYKSPSGKYTWNTTGQYEDTIKNKIGCDSLITINLTMGKANANTIAVKGCDRYVSPSKKRTWTISGQYKDTIINSTGCDSVLTINLTMGKSTASTINPKACNGYKSPSGKSVWVNSGTYLDTIMNRAGCDSLITIKLTINKKTFSQIGPKSCNQYTSPSGKYTFNVSNSFFDTIPNKAGCDSIILIDLIINTKTNKTISQTVCKRLVSPSGKHVYTVSGKYFDTTVNRKGCDSIITINLTVNSVNTIVTQNKTKLTAASVGGFYQWLDCNNNYVPISGEINQTYTVTAIGKYAVKVTEGLCTDTSVCINIPTLSIEKSGFTNYLSVFPNPAAGQFTMSSAIPLNNATIKIINTLGEIVFQKNNVDGTRLNLDISNHSNGIYFIEITENGNSGRVKLIKY